MWLAEGYLAAEDHASAWARAQEALEFSRRYKEKGQEVWTLHVLGEIARVRDPGAVEDAERFYREAIAIADTLGMRPLIAHCHLGLGKLYRRTGKREQAPEHLTTAMTMYREMGMTDWLEQAKAKATGLA